LGELEFLSQTSADELRFHSVHPLRTPQTLPADQLFSLLPTKLLRSQIFQVSHFMLTTPPPAAVNVVYNRASFVCLLLEMLQNQVY
jgi:hypothetical protein